MLSLDLQWSFIMYGDRIAFEASSKKSLDCVKEFFLWSIKSSVKHRFKMYALYVLSLVVRKAFFV